MRFTPRRSGRLKTTVRTVHHLAADDLAALLCRYADVFGRYGPQVWEKPPTPGVRLTRAQLDEVVRKALTGSGNSAYLDEDDWSEDYTATEAHEIAQWALAQINRLYPAFTDEVAAWARAYPPPKARPDDD
jgi:hypothetical protein